MIGGHLGADIAPLLDGQLSREATALAWQHVADCEPCSEEVAHQTWVKSRLLTLGGPLSADRGFKESLMGRSSESVPIYPRTALPATSGQPRWVSFASGVGVLGVTIVAVMAVTTGPANAPSQERRIPTNIVGTTPSDAPQK